MHNIYACNHSNPSQYTGFDSNSCVLTRLHIVPQVLKRSKQNNANYGQA